MKLTSGMYVIAVNDLQKSIEFYRDKLGFSIEEIGDDGWRIFRKDDIRIMAGHCPDATPAHELGDHSYFAYIGVDGIDDYYQFLRENGVRILKKIRNEPWGMREFAVQTEDGHRIMFGSDLA